MIRLYKNTKDVNVFLYSLRNVCFLFLRNVSFHPLSLYFLFRFSIPIKSLTVLFFNILPSSRISLCLCIETLNQ